MLAIYYYNLEAIMEELACHYNAGKPLTPVILRKDGTPAANCTVFKNDAGRQFYMLPTKIETNHKTGYQQINYERYKTLQPNDVIVYFIGHCSVFYAFTKGWVQEITKDWDWQENLTSLRLTITGNEESFELRTTKDPIKPYKHREFTTPNVLPA